MKTVEELKKLGAITVAELREILDSAKDNAIVLVDNNNGMFESIDPEFWETYDKKWNRRGGEDVLNLNVNSLVAK